MACFHPILAWQLDGGEIVFVERGKIRRSLLLPCNVCVGCRYVRARSWALRCIHESRCWSSNVFVTLTYDDAHMPVDMGLHYRDFQLFMKRLRKAGHKARFFMCGEYGDISKRPHFHALLFNVGFSNAVRIGEMLYSAPLLDQLWGKGFASFGSVTYESAGYVARYSSKNMACKIHTERYRRVSEETGEIFDVVPEFGHMSLKPGIGYEWFQKYWRDVYVARDGVVLPGGTVVPPPKYYDALLEREAPDLCEDKDYERYLNCRRFAADCTPERLAVRELCALERDKRMQRRLR